MSGAATDLGALRAKLREQALGPNWRSDGGWGGGGASSLTGSGRYSSLGSGVGGSASLGGSGSRPPAPLGRDPLLQPQAHTSLLATPASRHSGGRLAAQPDRSILAHYERGVEAAAGYRHSPAGGSLAGSGLAAGASPGLGGGAARFTPRDPSPLRHSQLSAQPAQRPYTSAAAASTCSPARKPSLLDQHAAAASGLRAKSSAFAPSDGGIDLLPAYRPAPMPAPAPANVGAQLRQMQLNVARTMATSTAILDATPGVGASPLSARVRQQPQLQSQPDFCSPAVLLSARGGGAGAMPVGLQQQQQHQAAAAAEQCGEADDGRPLAVSMRLTPMFEAIPLEGQEGLQPQHAALQPSAGSSGRAGDCSPRQPSQQLQQRERQEDWLPARGDAAAAGGWQAAGGPSALQLASRVNELEAKLQEERMRAQESARTNAELRQQAEQLRRREEQSRQAQEAAQRAEVEARARAREACQQAAALQEEVQRRQSVHSESMDSVARLTAVSQHHRQENEELRQRLQDTSMALEQEQQRSAQLQHQLQAAGSGEAQRLRAAAAAEADRRVAEAREAAAAELNELSSRCQLLAVEKVALEQRAKQAAVRQQAAEQQAEAAEAHARQLANELRLASGDSQALAEDLALARRQAEAAGEAARQARHALAEQQRRCEELEGELAGELERSTSIARRAETAEVAQQGLGSHVKAAHTRLQQLQEQLAAAQAEARQLRGEQEELRQAALSSQAALERQVSSTQSQLAKVMAERDQLRQRLAKANADLDAQLAAAGQHRQQVAALQQAEREARAAAEQRGAAAAQQGQQVLALQAQAEAFEARAEQLEGELHATRQQLVAAESRLAKAGRAPGDGASPLREAVGSLRQELQEKELQLMQAHEDLSKERARAQDLQKQVLDQAVELDEAQRDASEACLLRQKLADARAAQASLRQQLAAAQQQAAAAASAASGSCCGGGDGDASPRSTRSSMHGGGSSSDASPPRSVGRPAGAALQGRVDGLARELAAARQELARLRDDRDRLRDELDARDTEVMQLQGQLSMLQAAAADDADNWLSPLPDPRV